MSITAGLKGRAETTVTAANTAQAIGSGLVPVFGTPFMIALMEQASVNAIQPCLEPDQGSVGTQLQVAHTSATPMGMKVWANSLVTGVEGKKVTFQVTAFDEAGEIGHGTHERFLIRPQPFLEKAQGKLNR